MFAGKFNKNDLFILKDHVEMPIFGYSSKINTSKVKSPSSNFDSYYFLITCIILQKLFLSHLNNNGFT